MTCSWCLCLCSKLCKLICCRTHCSCHISPVSIECDRLNGLYTGKLHASPSPFNTNRTWRSDEAAFCCCGGCVKRVRTIASPLDTQFIELNSRLEYVASLTRVSIYRLHNFILVFINRLIDFGLRSVGDTAHCVHLPGDDASFESNSDAFL